MSKKNLKFHLDLLQAQLARINQQETQQNGKLFQTRFAVLKSSENADPQALEKEIAQTKKDLAARKIHHAQVLVQRQLKSAKNVEALKIQKRIKAADEARKPNLDAEKAYVDALDTAATAQEIVLRAVVKNFGPIVEFDKRQLPQAESNVLGRFGKLPAIKQAVSGVVDAIAEWYDRTEESLAKIAAKNPPKIQPQSQAQQFREAQQNEASNEADNEANNEADYSSDEDAQTKDQAEGPEEGSDEEGGFFDQDIEDVQIANSDDDSDNPPAFMQGYISGSDDDEPAPAAVPERKNRRGQRARRKIWEMKYGKRANHVISEQKQMDHKKHLKEERQRVKQHRLDKVQQEKEKLRQQPLHPSWEAKLKQKQQSQAQFAGKKKTFD